MERLRMIRALRWISGSIVGLGLVYLGCLLWPQPFFSHHIRAGNIHVYMEEEPPAAFGSTLSEVAALLSRSPLNDTSLSQRVFICGSLRQFAFFTRGRTYLGGLCDDRLSRNVFIHPADLAASRLQPYYGWRDERPLSYFMAHELTHSLESHVVGRWSVSVPVWLWEGYADCVGRGLDSASLPGLLRSGALYDRYALYVVFLLSRGRDIRSLLSSPPAQDSVSRAIRTFTDSLAAPAGDSAR